MRRIPLTQMLVADPLHGISLIEYAQRLRSGTLTAQAATAAFLSRIEVLDRKLGAFETVMDEAAMAAAGAVDTLLRAGTDFGPLMGVPIAVKDIFTIGMRKPTVGANLPLEEVVGEEGSFIRKCVRSGCILLGTTKTAELALGGRSGVNTVRGTPWNPWDAFHHRIPGASSSGSAVAVAAGLCGFAVGSDTGGSVRLPAAMCGVLGLKTSLGVWPTDGMFASAPTLDTIGILTRSARDAAVAFGGLQGAAPAQPNGLCGLRLGLPGPIFFESLDPEVERVTNDALRILEQHGAKLVSVEFPEAVGLAKRFESFIKAEIVSSVGGERLLANRNLVSQWTWDRIEAGFGMPAHCYIALKRDLYQLREVAAAKIAEVDAWIAPTTGLLPLKIEDSAKLNDGVFKERDLGPSTQRRLLANLLDFCAVSLPLQQLGASLPVGLQILCGPRCERKLLSVAVAAEAVLGSASAPDMRDFV